MAAMLQMLHMFEILALLHLFDMHHVPQTIHMVSLGLLVGSIWGANFWDHFWDHLWVTLGSLSCRFWHHFGITLGSLLVSPLGSLLGVLGAQF